MRIQNIKATLKAAVKVTSLLLFGAVAAFGQQVINLSATPTTVTLPDGSVIPMWGYFCGAVAANTAPAASCAALNPSSLSTVTTTPSTWSPVVITVPTGQVLKINLTNNLSFTAGTGTNTVPTSIMIVGQVGGGLGDLAQRTTTASPVHGQQQVTWPTADSGPVNNPPPQGPRVQSFSTEVAAGATTSLTWSGLKPGTYLLESGTHPSIQAGMGLIGVLVVTTSPTTTAAGTAYPAVAATVLTPAVNYNYSAEIPVVFSEIDPIQNKVVQTAVTTAGFSETTVWSGQPGGCGNASSPTYNTCYPPVVNYTPIYYLVNGVAFNKTNAAASLFPVSAPGGVTAGTGTVLVRMVNAGFRMHVPSILGSLTSGFNSAGAATTVSGFSLVAEDGNPLPGNHRVQSEVFMAAGKTFDVNIFAPASTTAPALPIYDRELSLSGGQIDRDAGMLAYIGINGSALPLAATSAAAVAANPDTYNSLVPGQTLIVSDPIKGVIANDVNVYGVQLNAASAPVGGTVTLNPNGTFTFVPATATTAAGSFSYCANGSTAICTTVTLGSATIESASGITCAANSFASTIATYLAVKTPGVLATCKDAAGYPLTVSKTIPATFSGGTVAIDANGGFTATATGAGTFTLGFTVQNSQGTTKAAAVTVTFPTASNLQVTVLDGKDKTTKISDYRWIIEEDRTFYVDPHCTTNPPPAGCPTSTSGIVPTFGVNFHTSDMPFVAQGCTGPMSCEAGQTVLGVASVCDVSNGVCRPGTQKTAVNPSQVHLDPSKRYYISVLPGDAANAFETGNTLATCSTALNQAGTTVSTCGHGMGGAPVAAACAGSTGVTCTATTPFAPVTALVQANPYPPGKLSVDVFEDDFPLNGEQDAGGGIDVLATNEPGLGDFNIVLVDQAGRFGDVTGQMGFDMFNQPLVNGLAGSIDPATHLDACPIAANPLTNGNGVAGDSTATGITGMIVTCPKYESDGKTLSPLAGQVVINNLMPGFFSVIATPGADRIARGEEWLQTNTLDGQKGLDAFIRIGEPSYFQEYGPAGYHDSIGFANPAIINGRKAAVCNGTDLNVTGKNCTNTLTGKITGERLSRTPDERLYSSGSRDTYYWTQCYVSFGDTDGEDFSFAKCANDGTFQLSGLPDGNWRLTVFDQWNDQIVDGLSTPVFLSAATNATCPGAGSSSTTCNLGDVAEQQWESNVYTRTFVDDNKDGVSQSTEAGIPLINTTVRFRDGSLANNLSTDFTGTANFNEEFPYFNWVVVEADTTRYKSTGTHTVYDVGGPADGSASCGLTGYPPCGTSTIGKNLANTKEPVAVPNSLRVPGAVYCDNADCTGYSIATGPVVGGSSGVASNCSGAVTGAATCGASTVSSGRIDPPWAGVEAWQGYIGQNNFVEFGKTPYPAGENGGIHGHVIYASTRPFDDPQMLVQTQWEPLVPNVTINLYKEGFAPDGVTPTLTLVDTTKTSSWDDYAQGFRTDGMPNMSCPGQSQADLFYFTLFNQPNYLNAYNAAHGGPAATSLPYNSQFKCYDGMHDWNQIQPAPYDGMYSFPSVTSLNPVSGKPTGTNCTGCVTDPDSTDPYRFGTPMLPAGKYVVEVVVPPGYELVKEEDKNILIGDNFIAPVTQEFPGLGASIFILPDQASVAEYYNSGVNSVSGSASVGAAGYNPYNAQNPTQSLGMTAENGIVPGFTPEPTWPCVGEARIIPDYISLFPQSHQVAPFAGATRNLCDRKEVTLTDQAGAIAKFYIYTSTHIAAKFTGIITDDFTSEFDPFAPTFGEKFSPPNLPVSFKDWTGAEISRVYSDQWGDFNGMTYSTWEVNPPNPTGYSPTMMVTCMNDPGPIPGPNGTMIPDPLFNPYYSQFCYENPYMPGSTQYMDTPVVPTSAFVSAGYNNPDCAYPTLTPAIKEVDGDGIGPYVSAAGHTLKITALGDQSVNNYGYAGPSATTAPYNQKTITRHYGFGATQGTGNVTIGGVTAPVASWTDTSITVTVPSNVPTCAVQQQAQYGGSTARCGELVITAGNGKQSVDAVTVTVGGKAPTHVTAPGPINAGTIQAAIDAAAPGDLIIVNPGTYNELVIMWKPVRLQGVGAASSIINANTHPSGLLDPWRHRVDCLFGIALDGQPYTSNTGTNPFDPTGASSCPGTGWTNFNGGPNNPQVDRVPLEGIVGWDTTVNGNLAELLQEPSLLGAYEGAGVTVLGKGVRIPVGSADVFGSGSEAGFPTGTTLLTANDCSTTRRNPANPFTSNFQCNPSSIDALSIVDSSQGGGGIALHAWNHNINIANNRIYNNAGTLSGGIAVGQGEFPEAYLAPNATAASVTAPGSCQDSAITNTQLPYCFNLNVNIHNNMITSNSSTGDELFSSTPAGAGGVTFCTGSDYYKFNYNWICGNISTGDGGGVAHLGFSYNGDIEHNSILFNQSTNPTIPTNGGGLIVMGAAPDGSTLVAGVATECGSVTDVDCVPGLSDGSGPGLVINSNLFVGNSADSGSGGALRFQAVNGADVPRFPANPERWYSVQVTNNIITNNVSGWDGAGISLEDALFVNIINNTIASNDTTASSGVLFNTIGAPLASSQTPPTSTTSSSTTSAPQPAGLVTMLNSPQLTSSLTTGAVTCPAGHFQGTTASNGTCIQASYPLLENDLFWDNSAYYIGVGALSAQFQQNIVSLYNAFTTTLAPSQPQADATQANGSGAVITGGTGACVAASYWDIGVRGDTGPTNHSAGITLAPIYSILTSTTGYTASGTTNLHNSQSNPAFVSQYCNGSRTPPELGASGWAVPPGIADATIPNPIFNLSPAATVDEGNNWINLSWGPLSLLNPVTNTVLGNYAPATGSPAIDVVPVSITHPSTDFFGNPRPEVASAGCFDIGAVETQTGGQCATNGGGTASATLTPTSHNFGTVTRDCPGTGLGILACALDPAQVFTLTNTGTVPLTGITQGVIGGTNANEFAVSRLLSTCGPAGNGQLSGQTTLAAGASCIITVQFKPLTAQTTGVKAATISVTDSAGTQTSTLTGTAR